MPCQPARRVLFACLLLPLTAVAAAAAQSQSPPVATEGAPAPARATAVAADAVSTVRRIAIGIALDGRLDEPDWFLADSITDFRQKEPTEGGLPSERTVVRLLATPEGLAIGWWLYDRDPSRIVRTQLRRDAELRSDDYVSMMIDGLSDRRSAFFFRTNANGALWDGEHVHFESGNEEWDGVWDARTQVNADGWTAEMLIPWATLRYPADVSSMGMNFRRFLPRTNEEVLWRAWKRGQGIRFLEDEGIDRAASTTSRRARAPSCVPFVLGEGATRRAHASTPPAPTRSGRRARRRATSGST